MSGKKVKIGSFLTERKERFKPDLANKLGLKRVKKIDFSGNIHLVEHKPTRTNMILVKKGDLLISGINAEKGAIAIYEYEEDAIATIHYSSYVYDGTQINIEYLKWFLKSNSFKQLLLNQAGSGIKSELKPKRFLPIEIELPSLNEQKEILNNINSINSEIKELQNLINESEILLSKLRQSILQDAIKGKLTQKWRTQNPNVEPASILLKKIKIEKELLIKEKKVKKEKSLPKITKDEIPFEVPSSWEWCRMLDISEKLGAGSTPKGGNSVYVSEGIMFFRSQNIYNDGLKLDNVALIPENIHEKMKGTKVHPKDILLNITGGSIGRSTLISDDFITGNVSQHVAIVRMMNLNTRQFVHNLIISPYFQSRIMEVQVGVSREGLSMTSLKSLLAPFPPLEEQIAIVEKTNQLLANCDILEQEIKASKTNNEKLMHSILSQLLGEENNVLVQKIAYDKEEKNISREIKYNSNTVLMDLVELLQKKGKLHAEDLWKMSKFPKDIDAFYTELKKQIEQEKTIQEVTSQKGYLELV